MENELVKKAEKLAHAMRHSDLKVGEIAKRGQKNHIKIIEDIYLE
jgi:hypothetical protein